VCILTKLLTDTVSVYPFRLQLFLDACVSYDSGPRFGMRYLIHHDKLPRIAYKLLLACAIIQHTSVYFFGSWFLNFEINCFPSLPIFFLRKKLNSVHIGSSIGLQCNQIIIKVLIIKLIHRINTERCNSVRILKCIAFGIKLRRLFYPGDFAVDSLPCTNFWVVPRNVLKKAYRSATRPILFSVEIFQNCFFFKTDFCFYF
jgi:hypothetical protein